ncbi:4Fe-4S binding protein [Pygmaiobacter massiliensis]|uniref:4Fe-4S binding protein n=1 Tax=Pygmaiobacter massiliensis TaxID=1917873 RepID=UPI002A81D05A|nr:4Fe-4S binding protein [Pygmaiobacter massiliensis]MDY4784542.1 4Fe-4S binding protein [Pygmaiobacter massiliensis]
MKINQVRAVYFSATGTTEKIVAAAAKAAAEQLGVPIVVSDFTLPGARENTLTFGAEELVFFGVPVYAGRVPNLLMPYVRDRVKGDNTLAVPIVLFGNRNFDDGLIELRNLLEADGCRTIAAGGFVGEHSFSTTLGAGRPDVEDMALAVQLGQTAAARAKALNELPTAPVEVRGEDPIRPYYTPRDRAGNPVNILKVKPKTSDACTKCGLCAEVCPMGSINKENPAEVPGICIKCCACVKKCPVGAKYYDDAGYLYHQHELEEGFARRAEVELF